MINSGAGCFSVWQSTTDHVLASQWDTALVSINQQRKREIEMQLPRRIKHSDGYWIGSKISVQESASLSDVKKDVKIDFSSHAI